MNKRTYKKSQPMVTTNLCSYGCGTTAKYINASGKFMCHASSNSCSVNKKKNSNGLKNCERDYKEVYENLSEETKDRMKWNKGLRYADFSYNGKGQHKNALLLERGHRCESCKLDIWMGNPITLELEHIDADRKNNTRENLKLLCPNCHSQTDTWRRGKGYSGWKKKKFSDEQIIEAIQNSDNLFQVLDKLDLRYGSVSTIIQVMSKYKVNFAEVA